jgi:hypothetical protein
MPLPFGEPFDLDFLSNNPMLFTTFRLFGIMFLDFFDYCKNDAEYD